MFARYRRVARRSLVLAVVAWFLFVISARDQDDWVGTPVNDRADFFKPC